MKTLIYTVIWTVLFVVFGLFVSFKAESFATEYVDALDKIEEHIKAEEWEECDEHIKELKDNFRRDSKGWFKLLNHCHLGDVELYFNVLIDGVYLKDVGMCLEQIECIKISLHRMIESEKHNLDHIL